MPDLVPGIHVFGTANKAWMAGTSPAMTTEGLNSSQSALCANYFSPVSGTAYFCSSGNCAAAKIIVSGRKPNTLKLTH
jgi:hypothetical protein